MDQKCPVCSITQSKDDILPWSGSDSTYISCPSCGKFIITGPVALFFSPEFQSDPEAVVKVSHSIRQMQNPDHPPALTMDVINKILENPLPRPREQADLLIRWLAENVKAPGETIYVDPRIHKSIIGAATERGVNLVLKHLVDIGLVTGSLSQTLDGMVGGHVTLSFEGWDYYENLRHGGVVYRKAFIAMRFGDKILEKIVANIFKPSVKLAGFDLVKLNDNPKAGLIDDRLRVEIQSSDFIIADLTHDNHGAYWEAGYAEGLGKPVIYTCEKSKFENTKTHFDTNHHLTIIWDKNSPEDAGEELKATIRATLPHLAKLND